MLRHGTLEIPGLNRPPEGWQDGLDAETGELDLLALRWAEPGAQRDSRDVQFIRAQASLDAVLDVLGSAAITREHGLDAYAAIALVQMETLHRRAAAGSGTAGLDTLRAALHAVIAAGELPPGVQDVFDAVRRLGTAPSGSGGKDAELDRLIGRIQALRAKTVEQGCTEQEALAAAEKVAELLDRYGLSLSELDLKRQACEGMSVETGRRRVGPVDDCVPAVAAFFDCRAWGEKSAAGTLRHVFFGLPADVAAARYLYELVERAFETETARFRAGETYAAMPTRVRRTATNSFGIGLARGIAAKLRTLREARGGAARLVRARPGVRQGGRGGCGAGLARPALPCPQGRGRPPGADPCFRAGARGQASSTRPASAMTAEPALPTGGADACATLPRLAAQTPGPGMLYSQP